MSKTLDVYLEQDCVGQLYPSQLESIGRRASPQLK